MYQPLEQFVINLIYIFPDFIINKQFLIFSILFTFFCFVIRLVPLFKISLLKFFIKLINEMFNVVNFTFTFILLVYLSIFLFILILNLCGLLPFLPCWTTQFFSNITLSFTLIIGLTIMNLDKNGILFFQLFVPQGVPQLLKAPLFALEFFSYFIRILSLSIRLFSNMLAGHSLLHILFDMSQNVHVFFEFSLDLLIFVSVFSLFIIVIILFFELIVAFLQAYVFAVMFVIYSNDLNLSH